MRAVARLAGGKLVQEVTIREHELTADEPKDQGGDDEGPSPQELLAASLASCTAITMEMYAQRKGWEVGDMSVDVNYEPAQRGSPTRFEMVVKMTSSKLCWGLSHQAGFGLNSVRTPARCSGIVNGPVPLACSAA